MKNGESGSEFRWRYYDDAMGETWSEWHVVADHCPACCCDGVVDGEHQEPSEYYEDGIPSRGHARYDPINPDYPKPVEWRSPTD